MKLLREQRLLYLVRAYCHNSYKCLFLRSSVKSLPSFPLSRAVFDALPRAEEQPERFWKYCPFGFTYRYEEESTRRHCIGQVVRGEEAFEDQVGAALLSLPERFINRYVPDFVPA